MERRARLGSWNHLGAVLGLWVGIWTLLAILDIGQTYLLVNFTSVTREDVPLSVIVGRGVVEWFLWVLLAPSLFWLAVRLPLDGRHWQRNLVLQTAASVVLSIVKVGIDTPAVFVFPCPNQTERSVGEVFEILFFGKFLIYLIICYVVLGSSHALAYYHKFRERELQASRLATELAQTQLQVLKMQLHPHFLFNTLHAISALIHKDVDLADRMIAMLGELLRSTLDHAGTQEVTLREELEFIKPYLEIEQARLGTRLSVHWDIDAAAMDANVPNLILQPLVENAIRHGIAPRAGPGRLQLVARRQADRVVLQVCDNGRGLAANYTEGVGLANTRARLQQLYGEGHQFGMRNLPGGGLEVTVVVPYAGPFFQGAPATGLEREAVTTPAALLP